MRSFSSHSLNDILSRGYFVHSSHLNTTQLKIDSLGEQISHEMSDLGNLACMIGSGLVFRGVGVGLQSLEVARGVAKGTALLSEVAAFRASSNFVNLLRGQIPQEEVFNARGFFTTALNFASLKLVGVSLEGQNAVLTNTLQASTMVATQNIAYRLGWASEPQGNLVSQFAHALSTNIAMSAGQSLVHFVTGGSIAKVERNLDLIEQSFVRSPVLSVLSTTSPVIQRFAAHHPDSPTERIVDAVNIADGCPFKRKDGVQITDRPVASLSPAETKDEYYELLLSVLPDIVGITRGFRRDYSLGLVEYASPGSTELVASVGRGFESKLAIAIGERGFLGASYQLHDSVARTIDLATEVWLRSVDRNDPRFIRLTELTCPMRRERFGGEAAQKRISSAMIQTVHISASFQRFILSIFQRKNGRLPTSEEMNRIYDRSAATAVRLTEFHLLRTRPIREVLGSESFGDGIVHLYTDDSHFDIIDDRLELVGEAFVEQMRTMPVDTSDGRIGCPGKKHIPDIWNWLQALSQEHAFPLLTASESSSEASPEYFFIDPPGDNQGLTTSAE